MFAGQLPSSSDPTQRPFSEINSALEAFRRLLLQIGGANIADADRAWQAASFVVTRYEKHAASLLLSSAARDPLGVPWAVT